MFEVNSYIEENGNFKPLEDLIQDLPEIEIFRLIIIHENNIKSFKDNNLSKKIINEELSIIETIKSETLRFGVNNDDEFNNWYSYWQHYFTDAPKRELKKYEKELKKITCKRALVKDDLKDYRPKYNWQEFINIIN